MRIKNYKCILALTILLLSFNHESIAQGCVAIRGNAACGGTLGGTVNLAKGEFFLQPSFRYFKSFRHFRGDTEETHRLQEGTEVINHSYFLDLAFSYGLGDRLFVNATLPFVFHNRSSMYEHGGNPPNGLGERHETSAKGLSDVRCPARSRLLAVRPIPA